MAVLQVLKGDNPGQVLTLEGSRAILGRHPDCDIVLDVGAVSRQHAQITQAGGIYYVEDLGSRNGTFVNGQQIQARHQLDDNDRVKICDLLFTFHFQEPGEGRGSKRPVADDDSEMALLVDDEGSSTSTVMTRLDVMSSDSGLRVAVRPEVKLRAMLDITQSIGGTIQLDDVLPKLLDGLFAIFIQADRGFVVLRMSPGGPLIPKAVKHRRDDEQETVRISRTIVSQVMNSKEAVLSADAASDARFDMSQSIADFQIRSMMCAPLVDSDGQSLGVIQVDTLDRGARFCQEDLDVLISVARLAAFAIENAQLHETALKQERIERDLALAHRVQQGLLPRAAPEIEGYGFFDFYEPASQLGGDYYDYIKLPGDRLAVVLADVSGKGIPAALLMAKLSADVRYSLLSEVEPSEAIRRLNASFISSGWEDRFVTLILSVIDLTSNRVTLVNAGHMPPLLRHGKGQVEPVGEDIAGLPVGVDIDAEYGQLSIELGPTEMLTMFTDGISEAMNSEQRLYGLDRLRDRVADEADGVADLGRHILDDVRQFVGRQQQSDDMCLTCFGRL